MLILVGILLVSTSLCAASANNEEKLDQLRYRIALIQKEIISKEAEKTEAADILQESERAISHANRQLVQLAKKKHTFEISLKQAQKQVGKTKSAIGKEKCHAMGKTYLTGLRKVC